MPELLLGCGHQRKKVMIPPNASEEWTELVTLDSNPDTKPDILHDLEQYPWPLAENFYDEIHAYEVLEHLGGQGYAALFFADFEQIWRALKPDGFLCASVPSRFGPWLWGDPGHRRVILPETLAFLDRKTYEQVGKTTLSDYRSMWRGDFQIVHTRDDRTTHSFILQAVKPIRE